MQEVLHVCNPLSVVCSHRGELRVVLDLRYAKGYLWKCSVKYEDCILFYLCSTVVIMSLLDLKSDIDINKEHWRY